MIEKFELVSGALDRLEKLITDIKAENDALRAEIAQLKNTIDDRDLEILQLQEDAEKLAAEEKAAKEDISARLTEIVERINAMLPQEAPAEPASPQDVQEQ